MSGEDRVAGVGGRRIPFLFLVDRSGSMAGPPIDQVNVALESFVSFLRADIQAAECIVLSAISFRDGDEVTVDVSWTEIKSFQPPRFVADGSTLAPPVKAMNIALSEIEKLTRDHEEEGVTHTPTWLFLMSGRVATDEEWDQAAPEGWEFIQKKGIRVISVTVPGKNAHAPKSVTGAYSEIWEMEKLHDWFRNGGYREEQRDIPEISREQDCVPAVKQVAEEGVPIDNAQAAFFQGERWKVIAASVTGPSHQKRDCGCEDAYAFKTQGEWLFAVVCDGAGSAKMAAEAARRCARKVVDHLAGCAPSRHGRPFRLRELVTQALVEARLDLESQATKNNLSLQDYYCTVIGLVARGSRGLFFHIGDGSAVAFRRSRNDVHWSGRGMSPPDNGEYANQAYFLSQLDWKARLRFTAFSRVSALALMTDGVTDFALEKGYTKPSESYFNPVLSFLSDGYDEISALALRKMLDREDARRVSSDDKTFLAGFYAK